MIPAMVRPTTQAPVESSADSAIDSTGQPRITTEVIRGSLWCFVGQPSTRLTLDEARDLRDQFANAVDALEDAI